MKESYSFWEVAKEDTFKDLRIKISALVAEESYDDARKEMQKELRLLAVTMKSENKNDQYAKLKEEFEDSLDTDVRLLLYTETPKADDRHDDVAENDLVKERTWPVPSRDEMESGLIIEIEDKAGERKVWEVVTSPFTDNRGEHFVRVVPKEGGTNQVISLAENGIAPYANGLWNSFRRPVRWYAKTAG